LRFFFTRSRRRRCPGPRGTAGPSCSSSFDTSVAPPPGQAPKGVGREFRAPATTERHWWLRLSGRGCPRLTPPQRRRCAASLSGVVVHPLPVRSVPCPSPAILPQSASSPVCRRHPHLIGVVPIPFTRARFPLHGGTTPSARVISYHEDPVLGCNSEAIPSAARTTTASEHGRCAFGGAAGAPSCRWPDEWPTTQICAHALRWSDYILVESGK
ncbi:unnamed protein product, partial [Urochloa humidicola]